MTSEIRVNKLTNRIGLSTVTFADSGIGVTVTGRIDPDTDSARDLGTTSVRWRNAYVDTYYGDGSNLTGISGVTINNNADNRVITGSGTANTLEGESNLTWDGTTLLANKASGTGVGYIAVQGGTSSGDYGIVQVKSGSTVRGRLVSDASVDAFRIDTAGGTNTPIVFYTGSSYSQRLRINSDGKILLDNNDGTLTIGGDNVYDNAKINLMVGNLSQTSATTEATAIVIHDQNSRRNNTEGTGSWKSKITFRSTQINGNNQSEGASIVHDITYNNYSVQKMRSDLVFKTRGDAQTAASDPASEKLRIGHDGKITVAANGDIRFTNGTWTGEVAGKIQQNSNNLYIQGGTGGIRFRHASSGVNQFSMTNGGNFEITDGDLVVASGHGIDFSATANAPFGNTSNEQELLDDYEEGQWVPVYSGSNGAGNVSYSYRKGYYIKIGAQVTVWIEMTISSATGMSGVAQISNLPFNKNDLGGNAANGSGTYYYSGTTNWYIQYHHNNKPIFTGWIPNNSNHIRIYNGDHWGNITNAPIDTTGRMSFSYTYTSSA